ncbi:Unknown protein, partial [Striga hermonthica]
ARSPPNQHSQETGHVYVETDSLLSPELTSEPLTGKIKVPQIGLYDGTSDPDAHLGHYTSWMDLHGATDALRCRMFSLTLGPKAQKWYYSLPAQSIRRWVQLRSAFRSHFIGAQVCLIPKESITNIVQKDDESLKEYVARFNERVQNMEPCHPETLLVSAISGLKPKSMFRWALCQNKPNTFQEFLVRAQNHVIAEESMSVPDFTFTSPGQKPTSEKKKKSFSNTHKKTSSTDPRWGDPNDPEVRAARKQYREDWKEGYRSIYSVGAAAIYEEIKGKGNIPDARPVKTPESQLDKGRYCDYHRSPGHNTDECLSLLSALMKLIGNPQVRKFTMAGDNKGKRRTQEIPDDDEGDERGSTFKRLRAQGDKEIFVIGPTDVGSPQDQLRKRGREADIQPRPSQTPPTSGRSSPIPRVNTNRDTPTSSRRQAKAYARKAYNSGKQVMTSDIRETINARTCPITFTLEDASLFDHPHSEALIITAPICGIPVHRIMVDTGAYTSILMLKAFNKLGIDPAEVRSCNDR